MNCEYIESLVYPTTRLRLFSDDYDVNELELACKWSKRNKDWIIMSRCGTTNLSYNYLLGARNNVVTNQILKDKLSTIIMQGVDNYGEHTAPDHVLSIINHEGKWILFDSYIDCRSISCFSVDLVDLIDQLNLLIMRFDAAIWKMLTGCSLDDSDAVYVSVTVISSDYDLINIDTRFWKLIDRAHTKLGSNVDDDHLLILSPSLNEEKADRFLDSLLYLIPNRSYTRKMISYVY